jgi:trimethylamine---corrinoid protein Co-methyltransferase
MKLNSLEALSIKDIEMIHGSTISILENIGLKVENKTILDIMAQNGCKVNYVSMEVKIPEGVVNNCLKNVPEKFGVLDREGNTAIILGDGGRYCASGHNAVFTATDDLGSRREAVLKDVEEFAVVSDHLSEINIIGVPYSPQDVDPNTSLLYAVKTIFENSKKPVFYSCESGEINRAVIEMAKKILKKDRLANGSCIISQLSTTSPLYWENGTASALYICANEGIPVDFLPQPITGVTAPYTLAGILTIHNTEVLSGIVISQLINPGTPVIYGAAWTTYEMKLANVLIGRPESSLLRIAGAQMAHYYKIPSHTTAPDNDSNLCDAQGSWEKMLSTVAGIAGANDLIVNLGMFGTGMSISLEQLVIDNEICRIVKRFIKGIVVNEDTIAYETIANVGIKGVFLMEEHTVGNLRTGEHCELDLSNGANYDVWKNKGAKSSAEKAKDIVRFILNKGNKSPIEQTLSIEINDIIKKYETSPGKKDDKCWI